MVDDEQLDRDAVSRILRRAAELADADGKPDPIATVEVGALIAAAGEVGISPEVMHRSIAIERLGPPPARSVGDRLLGPAIVSADDEMAVVAETALRQLDEWLVDGHHLRRDRLRAGQGEWSKRSGVMGATMRAVRATTGEGQLGDVSQITATARDVADGSCVVRISADRTMNRKHAVIGGAAVGTIGVTGAAIAAVVASPVAILVSPVALIIGVGVASTSRGRARRTERELQRLLEAVHQGVGPTRLSLDVARRVTGRARAAAHQR